MVFEDFACPHCGSTVKINFDGYMDVGKTMTLACECCKKKITGIVCFGLQNAYLDVENSSIYIDIKTKYDWNHAPDSVNYGVMLESGNGFWLVFKPIILADRWIIKTATSYRTFIDASIDATDIYFTGSWKESLEERPKMN